MNGAGRLARTHAATLLRAEAARVADCCLHRRSLQIPCAPPTRRMFRGAPLPPKPTLHRAHQLLVAPLPKTPGSGPASPTTHFTPPALPSRAAQERRYRARLLANGSSRSLNSPAAMPSLSPQPAVVQRQCESAQHSANRQGCHAQLGGPFQPVIKPHARPLGQSALASSTALPRLLFPNLVRVHHWPRLGHATRVYMQLSSFCTLSYVRTCCRFGLKQTASLQRRDHRLRCDPPPWSTVQSPPHIPEKPRGFCPQQPSPLAPPQARALAWMLRFQHLQGVGDDLRRAACRYATLNHPWQCTSSLRSRNHFLPNLDT